MHNWHPFKVVMKYIVQVSRSLDIIILIFDLNSLWCSRIWLGGPVITFTRPTRLLICPFVMTIDLSSFDIEYVTRLPPDFLKYVSFHVKFGYMGFCDFSINNTCLVTWLLTWNITFWVKYSIKKIGCTFELTTLTQFIIKVIFHS